MYVIIGVAVYIMFFLCIYIYVYSYIYNTLRYPCMLEYAAPERGALF